MGVCVIRGFFVSGFRILLLGLLAYASAVKADLPDYQSLSAAGERRLLWVPSEQGLSEPERHAAQQLAKQGTEVWLLDLTHAYFLPQLPSSMDAVPLQDLVDWLRAAQADGRGVTVYAVARAAVPVLRAAARLEPAQRARLCVLLMYPNLYTALEPLAEPGYLDLGDVVGLRVHLLQPRRSAATPWLPGQLAHLALHGAAVSHVILENLREAYWERETPTDFEVAESRRMDAMLLREMSAWGCK